MTIQQLSNAKEIALAQIDSQRKNAQLEFNKTVLSGNRQAWINELRELISKLLSNISTITLKQSLTISEFETLRFQITKTELMLNVEKDRDFITALIELEKCCLDIIMQNKELAEIGEYADKVKELTQSTLNTEWQRVKKGE